MTSASKEIALCLVVALAGCAGSSGGFSEEQQLANREAFKLFALGEVYVGRSTVVAHCEPQLSPAQAYPGIAATATWTSGIIVEELTDITHAAASGELNKLVLFVNPAPVGFEIADRLLSVAPYDGATAPGIDAEFTCGELVVRPDNVVRTLYTGGVGGTQFVYGMSADEMIAAIAAERESVAPMRATQESFLVSAQVADPIVGVVDWPPPSAERND